MKKTILFVVLQQYADWEAAYISSAVAMLGEGQYEIKTVSLSKDYASVNRWIQNHARYDITSVPSDLRSAHLIGGMTWRNEMHIS